MNRWRECFLVCACVLGSLVAGELLMNGWNVAHTVWSAELPVARIVDERHPVLSLPGKLDAVEVFNSNSPEIVQNDGILLSTFPPEGKSYPEAHLQRQLRGRVDFFVHHINNRLTQADTKTVHLGLLVQNAGSQPATIKFLSGASYLSQPDSPFSPLPSLVPNDDGRTFAGPGDRVSLDIMNDRLDKKFFPSDLVVAPGEYALIFQAPIPVVGLEPHLNGRTALFKIDSDQPLYACLQAKLDDSIGSAPSLDSWLQSLKTSNLVQARERAATPLDAVPMIYGRVSGIGRGAVWNGVVENNAAQHRLDLKSDSALSLVIDTVANGTFGTAQIQSAPLIVRYSDTAYAAHGNYGIWYKLRSKIFNSDSKPILVQLSFDTPIKNNLDKDVLHFFESQAPQVYFRGTVRTRIGDSSGASPVVSHTVHLVEHRGERGQPLCELQLEPKQGKELQVDFIYPADCTPPHVLSIRAQPQTPSQ